MRKPRNYTLNSRHGINGWVSLKAIEKHGKRSVELNSEWNCRLTKRNCKALSTRLLIMAYWIKEKDNE